MKIEKNKHDHKLTHLLKVCIFAMLMIAPLFASCSQLLYVTFNKNAYQSSQIDGVEYYTTYEYETNEVNSVDDLIVGNIYRFHLNGNVPSGNNSLIEYSKTFQNNYTFNCDNGTSLTTLLNQEPDFYINLNNGYCRFMIIKTTDGYSAGLRNSVSNDNVDINIYFIYKRATNADLIMNYISASDYLGEKTVNERPVQALDNAFYYGVEKMTESPLFNWTQNTALYSGIKAMTDNLQVQTNVIAVLVTYWTILTIIYIIIDIVLALFTKMTHLLVRSD